MKRLHSLDALRGVAALSIVVWHWQHFFAVSGGGFMPGWKSEQEPFYWLLKPLYVQGWAAVDLFFVLSGFVFFWLYGDAIRERTVAAGKFAWLRFSRLYPLHVVLLLAVALLQLIFYRAHGLFFIYQANDLPHFLAHLLMVQNWWPGSQQSFDGPSWSVSIEVLLYILFFAACRAGLKRGPQILLVALLGVPLFWLDEHIARGVIGFFMGGVVHAAWQSLQRRGDAARISRILDVAVPAAWAGLCVLLYTGNDLVGHGETNDLFLAFFDFILCPLTVLALALNEQQRGPGPAWLGFLGDISYSSYLLHFPMQLALAVAATYLALTPRFFMQGWVMIAFYAVLIGLATLSYRFLERPAQSLLRRLGNARSVTLKSAVPPAL